MNTIFKITTFSAIIAIALFTLGCEESTQESETVVAKVAPVVIDAQEPAKTEPKVERNQTFPAKKPEIEPVVTPTLPTVGASLGVNSKADSGIAANGDVKNASQQLTKEQVVVASPNSLDLGEISTSEKANGIVTLRNTSDESVTILTAKASCGCTTSDFKNNTVLGPGGSVDVNVVMDGKGRARTISKVVTFSIDGYPPLRYPVQAKAIAFVTLDIDPLTIDEDIGKSELVLTSIDGQPFKILSMIPSIAEPFSEEAASSQKMTLDWERFWDLVATTKFTIRLDHPLCKQITTTVRLNPEQRQRLNGIIVDRRENGELPSKSNSPLTGDQLSRYIKSGQGDRVLEYIQDGKGKFDAVDRGGVVLLSTAAQEGDADTVAGLIELGADIESVDRVNRTPIMYAARSKDPEAIGVLLTAGADIQAMDNLGNTPLSWAAGFGSAEGVQVLIDAGADANTRDLILGYTPLLWASGFGDSMSIPILIEADADVNVRDNAEGRSPLMHSVRTGTIAGVRVLLEAGANVNDLDNIGMTALLIGAGNNNVKIEKIKLLVEGGADVNLADKDGMTALKYAKTRTDDGAQEIIQYLEERTSSE